MHCTVESTDPSKKYIFRGKSRDHLAVLYASPMHSRFTDELSRQFHSFRLVSRNIRQGSAVLPLIGYTYNSRQFKNTNRNQCCWSGSRMAKMAQKII